LELCHLTWQDIDLKAKVLHVRGNASRYYKVDAGTGERTWVVKKEEEAQERAIPLAPPQVKFLGQEEGKYRPFVEIHPRKSMEQMISGLCQASPAGSDYSSTETES